MLDAKEVPKLIVTQSVVTLCGRLSKQMEDAGRESYSLRGAADAAGVSRETLLLAIIISFVIFVWAIYALVVYGPSMPMWALVLGIVFLFIPPGPLVSLLLVYALHGTKHTRSAPSRRRSSAPSRRHSA